VRLSTRSHAHWAALALGRRHEPGVEAEVTLDAESVVATLVWEKRPAADALQLDYHRVTEDGAEAVALALVHSARSWVVLRRLQREEHADWLLRETTSRRLVCARRLDDGFARRHADGHLRGLPCEPA
jgi:hypothetical protein